MEKKKRNRIILGSIAGVVIIAIIVAWVTGFFNLAGFFGLGAKHGPEYMPDDTWLYVSINPTLKDQDGFQHIADYYQDIDGLEDELDDFMDMLDDEYDIVFEDDIRPWMGSEIAFGVIDEVNISRGLPRMALVIQSRNDKEAEAFLEKMEDAFEDEFDVDDDSYEDIDYLYFENEYGGESFSMGLVKGYLVVAYGNDAMEDVIDSRKNENDSLDDDDRFERVVDNLPKNSSISIIFDYEKMDLPIMDLVEEVYYYADLRGSLDFTDALDTLMIGLALDLTDEGVLLEAVSMIDPDELSDEYLELFDSKSSSGKILKSIPDEALAFFSGNDLGGSWRALFNLVGETSSDLEYQIEDFADAYGMDVDEELFSWADGEYSLILVEADALDGELSIGGALIQDIGDQEEAEDFMDDLVDAFADFTDLDLDLNTTDFGKTEIQMMGEDFVGEDIIGYGFISRRQMIVGFTEDALETLLENNQKSIESNDYFRKVKSQLPSTNHGYIYLNVEGLIDQALELMGDYERDDFEDYFEDYLDPIKALGLASSGYNSRSGVSQTSLFIYIP